MSNRTVVNGTARLAASEWPGDGPSVVALHPGVGDRPIWERCAPAWADAGSKVVTYDRRGFGETIAHAEAHDDLDDLRAVTRATGSRPAVIVGNSRGGGLALDLALAEPQEVAALVLVSPSPTGYDQTDWPTVAAEAEHDEIVAAAEESGDLDLVNRLEARYWLDGVEQPDGRVAGPARELFLAMNGRALAAQPIGEPAARAPAWDRLGEIGVPVLCLVGEHDLPGIRILCQRLCEALPDASMRVIEGSAHCPSLDQPDRLNSLIIEFLRTIRT